MSAQPGRPKKEMTQEEAVKKLTSLLGTRVGAALNKIEMVGRCGAITSHFDEATRNNIAQQVGEALLDQVKKAASGLAEGKRPKPLFELKF